MSRDKTITDPDEQEAKLKMGVKVLELYINPDDGSLYFVAYEALPVLLKMGAQVEEHLKEKLAYCRDLWVKPN
jgi:hypothetical protein